MSSGPLTPLGLVLQLQGGNPQQKVGSVFAEKLKLIKALEGGQLSPNMLQGLLGGQGLGSIFQNPAGGILSSLGGLVGTLGSAISTLGGAAGAGGTPATPPAATTGGSGGAADVSYPLTLAAAQAALPQAQAALAYVQGLAGMGPASPYGPLDLALHHSTVGSIGTTVPAYAFGAAVAPLLAPAAAAAAAQAAAAAGAIGGLQAGTLTDADAAAAVAAQGNAVAAAQAGSSGAIGGLQGAIITIATVQAIAALALDPGQGVTGLNTDPAVAEWLTAVVQPAQLAALLAQAEAEYAVEPPTITTLAPTINTGNVTYSWMGVTAAPAQPAPLDVR